MAAQIHPTAIVAEGARLGEGVALGPNVVIEPDVVVGDRCRLLVGAVLHRYTEMGPDNVVGPYCVFGGLGQDSHFDPETPTGLRIGSGNVFREHVTLNRATAEGGATTVGSGGYFMTHAHVGHDCRVGDRVILANNAAVAGHCEIGDAVNLSANCLIHQFCWVGEGVMMRGGAGVSNHAPPFVIVVANNLVTGLNVVGLRRAGYSPADRRQVKEAYRFLYRAKLTPARALEQMDAHTDWGDAACRFREFVRRALAAERPFNRGIVTARVGQRARHVGGRGGASGPQGDSPGSLT